jgi:hypothetical protein
MGVMSYDLVIEPVDGEPFDPGAVEQAIGGFVQLRRYDAESYRSAGGLELVLVAERPGLPVESLTLQIPYASLPAGFDSASDLALGLAGRLGGRVVDAQHGETVTADNRAAARRRAEETARWVSRLGSEFEAPPKAFVDEPRATVAAPRGGRPPGGQDRPWWKFWER